MVAYSPTQSFEVEVHEQKYRTDGNESWIVRIYQSQGTGPFPALLDVHGGAWKPGGAQQRRGDESRPGRQRHGGSRH